VILAPICGKRCGCLAGDRASRWSRADEVVGLLIRQGVVTAALGAAVGLVLAGTLAGLFETMLHGVSTHDVITFLAAPVLLLSVAALASYLPARRAAHVDPLEALRHE